MSERLADRLGVGPSELVAFTGAGGKSTLLFGLAAELAAGHHRVVVTTTTKLGAGQVPAGWTVCRPSPAAVEAALAAGSNPVAAVERDGHKLVGPELGDAAALLTGTTAVYLLVEADGARGLSLKAPAGHEPAVPPAATLVVVCAGLDAVGRTLVSACHRPALAARLAGRAIGDPIRPEDMAAVLGHRQGGLARVPDGARVVVALTKAQPGSDEAGRVAALLAGSERIERVAVIAASEAPAPPGGR